MVDERERRLCGWWMRDSHPTPSQQQTGRSISIAQHHEGSEGARICMCDGKRQVHQPNRSINHCVLASLRRRQVHIDRLANGPSRPLQQQAYYAAMPAAHRPESKAIDRSKPITPNPIQSNVHHHRHRQEQTMTPPSSITAS